jgi:mono/diheme cytochrome c family protein
MAIWGLVGVFVVMLVIQTIPYGRDHSNPPVRQEPVWDSQQTRALAASACFDCHSNQTNWPWYSNVAPASWLIQRDVDGGRQELNLSEWDRPQPHADHAAEVVQEGEMPPFQYRLLHPGARLSSTERQALIQGLEAMFGPGEGANKGQSAVPCSWCSSLFCPRY